MASSSVVAKEVGDIDADINDIFDNIVLSEQRVSEEGFREGFEKGLVDGEIEGYHLGYHRGAELGAELGYYRGVVDASLALHKNRVGKDALSDKVLNALHKVSELLEQFPTTNTKEIDIINLRDDIRAKYKKACSLMKIMGTYPETSKFSF